MSTQSDAVRAYITKHGIKQKHLAEICEVTPATMSSILTGRYPISREVALRLTEKFGFDIHFLMTGEGDLFPIPGATIRRINQAHNSGQIVNGSGAISIASDSAAAAIEIAQLREQLAHEREEKNRLLKIIETITTK